MKEGGKDEVIRVQLTAMCRAEVVLTASMLPSKLTLATLQPRGDTICVSLASKDVDGELILGRIRDGPQLNSTLMATATVVVYVCLALTPRDGAPSYFWRLAARSKGGDATQTVEMRLPQSAFHNLTKLATELGKYVFSNGSFPSVVEHTLSQGNLALYAPSLMEGLRARLPCCQLPRGLLFNQPGEHAPLSGVGYDGNIFSYNGFPFGTAADEERRHLPLLSTPIWSGRLPSMTWALRSGLRWEDVKLTHRYRGIDDRHVHQYVSRYGVAASA